MQQGLSARLTLPPCQINLNSLQEKKNKAKYQKLCLFKCCCRSNDWERPFHGRVLILNILKNSEIISENVT